MKLVEWEDYAKADGKEEKEGYMENVLRKTSENFDGRMKQIKRDRNKKDTRQTGGRGRQSKQSVIRSEGEEYQ